MILIVLKTKHVTKGETSGYKGRDSVAVISFEDSTSKSFGVAIAKLPFSIKLAASKTGLEISKDTLIGDSSAFHYFVNDTLAFIKLTRLPKPFGFD